MSLMRYTFSTSPPSSMPCSVVFIGSSSFAGSSFQLRNLPRSTPRPIPTGVTHPHLKRTFWPLLSSGLRFCPVHAPPPQALLRHCRPNSALSPDCSPLTSDRGRFAPVSATKSRLRPLRHQTPFPVHPHYCTKRLIDCRPSVVPPCMRSFSAIDLFTLAKGRAGTRRSDPARRCRCSMSWKTWLSSPCRGTG